MTLSGLASWRYLWRHPWQMALVVLGVAIGVAVVVAVDLANASAMRALTWSIESTAGRATHQIIATAGGLDERLYRRLRMLADAPPAAPVVEAYGTLAGEGVHLLGVDVFAEPRFRAHLEGSGAPLPLARLVAEPDTLLLAAETARRLGLSVGDRTRITLGGRTHTVTLIGVLASARGSGAPVDGLAIADIATAQELTGTLGRLSWIDLILPPGEAGVAQRARISGLLPGDAELVTAGARGGALAQMTRAFRINLTAMSLLALIVGMFLIYNATSFAVLQRRPLIGTLRALGTTRAQVFWLVVREAAMTGLAGSLLGLGLGVLLANTLTQLVTSTINDLYFVLHVSAVTLAPLSLLKGVLFGTVASVAAALVPALEAAGTRPQLALRRSTLETRVRAMLPRLAAVGGALLVGGAVVLWRGGHDLVAAFGALFLVILGLTLFAPLAVTGMTRLAEYLLGGRGGVVAHLAVRGIAASLSRTGVAIAALMLAVATTTGVGVMVASFRGSVEVWLDSTLRADIYVAAPSLRSSRTPTRLDPGVIERVRQVPGVATVAEARFFTVESQQGTAEILAVDVPATHAASVPFKHGDPARAWPAFHAGDAVLVSEPYAYRHALVPGDELRLRTDGGWRKAAVAGVVSDYSSEQGMIIMSRRLYARWFRDPSLTSLRLYLAPGAARTEVMEMVRSAARGDQAVIVRSNHEIRVISLAVFDRTFVITNVLRLLAMLVAFVGILSAFMALQLERTREWALLRATGMTPGNLRALIGAQTGLMGLAAGVLAVPVGLTLALLLVHVINRRAFGWTMQTWVPSGVLVEAVGLAVVAALIAGLYPAWKIARLRPAEGLRTE